MAWGRQELKHLKVDGPVLIEISGGTTLYIDKDNNVTVDGFAKVKLEAVGDELDLVARQINILADEEVYIGAGKHAEIQAPRIDFNPRGKAKGNKRK